MVEKDKLSEIMFGKKVLKALEEAIDAGSWEAGAFLKAIGKNLEQFRKELHKAIAEEEAHLSKDQSKMIQFGQDKSKTLVYISLYNVDGNNLQKWEKIVQNIESQAISRPVYANEADIKSVIRSKRTITNEAYAAVYVPTTDIATSAEPPNVDRLGNLLLILKANSVQIENIAHFEHISGRYEYQNRHLIQKFLL